MSGASPLLGPRERGVVRVGKAVFEIEDPKWYQHANCAGADMSHFDLDGDQSSVRVVHSSMQHCLPCTVRSDCVIDALSTRDRGVVRGGIAMQDKMKHHICSKCKLPVAGIENKLCSYCRLIRECQTCGCTFAAQYVWLRVDKCDRCKAIEKLGRPRRSKIKKRKPVRVFRRRRGGK